MVKGALPRVGLGAAHRRQHLGHAIQRHNFAVQPPVAHEPPAGNQEKTGSRIGKRSQGDTPPAAAHSGRQVCSTNIAVSLCAGGEGEVEQIEHAQRQDDRQRAVLRERGNAGGCAHPKPGPGRAPCHHRIHAEGQRQGGRGGRPGIVADGDGSKKKLRIESGNGRGRQGKGGSTRRQPARHPPGAKQNDQAAEGGDIPGRPGGRQILPGGSGQGDALAGGERLVKIGIDTGFGDGGRFFQRPGRRRQCGEHVIKRRVRNEFVRAGYGCRRQFRYGALAAKVLHGRKMGLRVKTLKDRDNGGVGAGNQDVDDDKSKQQPAGPRHAGSSPAREVTPLA